MKNYTCFKCGWKMDKTIGVPVLTVFKQNELPKSEEELKILKIQHQNLAFLKDDKSLINGTDSSLPIGSVAWKGTKLKCPNPNCGHTWEPNY